MCDLNKEINNCNNNIVGTNKAYNYNLMILLSEWNESEK